MFCLCKANRLKIVWGQSGAICSWPLTPYQGHQTGTVYSMVRELEMLMAKAQKLLCPECIPVSIEHIWKSTETTMRCSVEAQNGMLLSFFSRLQFLKERRSSPRIKREKDLQYNKLKAWLLIWVSLISAILLLSSLTSLPLCTPPLTGAPLRKIQLQSHYKVTWGDLALESPSWMDTSCNIEKQPKACVCIYVLFFFFVRVCEQVTAVREQRCHLHLQ